MSNNKIATIEIIHSIREHPNADALDIGMIRGFQVIVKKGEYKHGDKVIFVWPDTICQPAPWNEFLDKKKNGSPIKIKSCKLRGFFSTGLVLPYLLVPGFENKEVGEDVSFELGVEKYIKEIPVSGGETKGTFPTHIISKTDETLAQSEPNVENELRGKDLYVTLKIDGQSLTFIRYNDEINVCSRNLEIKEGENRFWNTVRKYGLIEKTEGMNIAIQGEQYGPSIQKNPMKVEDIRLAVFNIKDLDTGEYYSYDRLVEFCKDKDIPMVPISHEIAGSDEVCHEFFQAMADGTKYNKKDPAEGIVVRPKESHYSPALGGMLSVKFINRNYKD